MHTGPPTSNASTISAHVYERDFGITCKIVRFLDIGPTNCKRRARRVFVTRLAGVKLLIRAAAWTETFGPSWLQRPSCAFDQKTHTTYFT